MMSKSRKKKAGILAILLCAALSGASLSGCAVHSESSGGGSADGEAGTADQSVELMIEITDPEEKAAVEAAKKKVQALGTEPKIIATSPSTVEICDRLELDLAGVCSSTISELPERYADAETVGTAMAPDMEIVASLDPDWILSPAVRPAAQIRGHRYGLGVSEPAERPGHVPLHPGIRGDFRQRRTGAGYGGRIHCLL